MEAHNAATMVFQADFAHSFPLLLSARLKTISRTRYPICSEVTVSENPALIKANRDIPANEKKV